MARLQGYYFFREPLIRDPPATPLPDPDEDPDWYGEIWLRYPLSSTLYPAHLGYTMRSISQLRVILCEIAWSGTFRDRECTRGLSYGEVMQFKKKLDSWFDCLPDPLKPNKVVFPWHLKTQYVLPATIRGRLGKVHSC